MMVDTGSAVTLVHQRVLDRSPKNFKLSVVGEPAVSANSQPLDIRGKCDLEICVDGVNIVHSVLVAADVTQDCLLGIDFLGKHGCKIDFEAKVLLLLLLIIIIIFIEGAQLTRQFSVGPS